MSRFKFSLAYLLVLQVVHGYSAAADYDAASTGAIMTDMSFSGTDTVLANIKDSLSAGTQNFHDASVITASVANAVSGGIQNLWDKSDLRVTAANALSGSQINLQDKSRIHLLGVDNHSNTLAINLVDYDTALNLGDQSATIGKLEGSGYIYFGDGTTTNNTLTLDTSRLGSSTFDGELWSSGTVNLVKQGGGEWIFNGNGREAEGAVSVDGGLLTVNGDLSTFSVAVKNGASLGGTGTVGNTTVASGGGLGSGSSKGVFSVQGDLKLGLGSVLFVNADANGNAGQIDVSKTATLDRGYVQVLADSGRYAANTRYTILTAADGVSGKFMDAYSDLYFLTAMLHYTANAVELELQRNTKLISSVAHNPSAVNAAQVIGDQTPDLLDHLLASSQTTAGQALDQLAGAAGASRAAALLASTAQVGGTMLTAMDQLDEARNSLQAPLLASNGPLLVASGASTDGRGVYGPTDAGRLWVQALGSQGDFEGTDETNNIQQQTAGALVGMDWAANSAWRLGVLGGYSTTRLDANDFLNDRLNSYHLGAFARHQNGVMVTRMGLAYSSHQGNSKREIDFNGFHDAPKGNYDASNQQGFVEFALPTSSGGLYKEPFARLGYQRFSREAYNEKGGIAALHVDDQQQSNLISTLGLRIARQGVLDNGMTLARRASLGWRHTYGDTDLSTRQAFLTGSEAFDVYGSTLDRDSVMVEAGVGLGLSAAQDVSLNYSGEFGSNARNHGLAAEWRLKF